MYKVTITATGVEKGQFKTEAEATAFVKAKKKAKGFFTIAPTTVAQPKAEKPEVIKAAKPVKAVASPKTPAANWKAGIDFTGAVKITRENVKGFYGKSGYIQVVSPAGKQLHVGKTTNMGKVFSNYVNCAKYNQSYDFNLAGGDSLLFKESTL